MAKFKLDYDDDDYGYDNSYSKDKKKYKGHQNKYPKKESVVYTETFMAEEYEDVPQVFIKPKTPSSSTSSKQENNVREVPDLYTSIYNKDRPVVTKVDSSKSSTPSPVEKRPFEFGPNTHEISPDVKIDFDRVLNMEKIDSEFKGHQTYGIKFYFKGRGASTKVVWYNQRERERDMVFNREQTFWHSL